MIMINTSKVREMTEVKEGSKRGKASSSNLIASNNMNGNVILVHRKRKL